MRFSVTQSPCCTVLDHSFLPKNDGGAATSFQICVLLSQCKACRLVRTSTKASATCSPCSILAGLEAGTAKVRSDCPAMMASSSLTARGMSAHRGRRAWNTKNSHGAREPHAGWDSRRGSQIGCLGDMKRESIPQGQTPELARMLHWIICPATGLS